MPDPLDPPAGDVPGEDDGADPLERDDGAVAEAAPEASATGVTGTLTDGAGVSAITSSKLVKDAVVDFLMGLPPALLAVNISGVPTNQAAFVTAVIAVGGVFTGVAYRTALRWATTN